MHLCFLLISLHLTSLCFSCPACNTTPPRPSVYLQPPAETDRDLAVLGPNARERDLTGLLGRVSPLTQSARAGGTVMHYSGHGFGACLCARRSDFQSSLGQPLTSGFLSYAPCPPPPRHPEHSGHGLRGPTGWAAVGWPGILATQVRHLGSKTEEGRHPDSGRRKCQLTCCTLGGGLICLPGVPALVGASALLPPAAPLAWTPARSKQTVGAHRLARGPGRM